MMSGRHGAATEVFMMAVLRGLIASIVLLEAASIGGCSGDDVASAKPTTDASVATDASAVTDTATPVEAGPPLCTQLGGWSAVQKIVGDAAGIITTDCRLAVFFDPKRGGRLTYGADHVGQCLMRYFGAAAQCVDTTGAPVLYDKDNAGIACRDMYAAHKGLGLSDADFAAFVEDLVKALDANGLTDAQKAAVVNAVQSSFVQVTESPAAGNSKSTCDGGAPKGDASSGDAASVSDAADAAMEGG